MSRAWLALWLVFVPFAQSKPVITWLQADWPPHQIVSGQFQDQGTFDLIRQQIVVAMPQYSHRTRLVSLARLEQIFLQQTPGFCTLGTLYSKEREATRLYSTPISVGPAISVGFVQQRLLKHPSFHGEAVNITELAMDNMLRGAYQPDRYYPPLVGSALKQAGNNLSSHAFTSELNATALLANGRVDYVIEYPERMRYYNQLLAEPVALMHRMIAQANDVSVSHITCSQTRDGEKIIKVVNSALRHLWQQPEYMNAMRRWLDDEAWQRIQPAVQDIKLRYVSEGQ